ncbi:MAG: hypothetical protein LBH10_03280 [Burkholderiaceae bacterium]|nr:hypothetical protein [Burkholderiaceae bacterium]
MYNQQTHYARFTFEQPITPAAHRPRSATCHSKRRTILGIAPVVEDAHTGFDEGYGFRFFVGIVPQQKQSPT